jgi:putative transposase
MDNHYHLLVRTPLPSLSDAMKFLGASHAQKLNHEQKTDGPVFRGRFKAILLDADDYLVQVSRYIHRNPVEAKMVKQAEDYAWSSFKGYENSEDAPHWLRTYAVLSKAGMQGNVDTYCRFVNDDGYPSMRDFYNSRQVPGVLGSNAFRHYVSALGFRHVAPKREESCSLAIERIADIVGRRYQLASHDIRNSAPGKANPARLIAMHVCDKLSGADRTEIAAYFRVSPTTLPVTLSRFRAKVKVEKHTASLLLAIENALRSGNAGSDRNLLT